MKTIAGLRKTKYRGFKRVRWAFTLAAAAYNLIRLPKLMAAARTENNPATASLDDTVVHRASTRENDALARFFFNSLLMLLQSRIFRGRSGIWSYRRPCNVSQRLRSAHFCGSLGKANVCRRLLFGHDEPRLFS
jgi:hypothetical protein